MLVEVLVGCLILATRKDKFLKKHEEENKDGNKSTFELYPKFSFEFSLSHKRSIEKCANNNQLVVVTKLLYLSGLTWKKISQLPREQGFEKIEKKTFKSLPNLPNKFKDVSSIDVFRLPKKKGRLMGFIEDGVFYVVWVDTKFDMYDH